MKMFDKSVKDNILVGPATVKQFSNYLYPNEQISKDEIILWNPELHKTVSLKSYEKAHQEEDVEALGKISKIGIPLGCTFGGAISLKKEY